MSLQVVMKPPCPCDACSAGVKIVSQAQLAKHFGIDGRLMRELIADGLPGYKPSTRKWPVYSIEAAEAWWHAQGRSAA